jgi:hypothetical protein
LWCGEVTRPLQSGIDWYHPPQATPRGRHICTELNIHHSLLEMINCCYFRSVIERAPICTRGTKGEPINTVKCWVGP